MTDKLVVWYTLGLLEILVALNILDLVTTDRAIRIFRAIEPSAWAKHEKNPLARFVLLRGGGIPGLLCLKLWAVTLVLFVLAYLSPAIWEHMHWPLIVVNLLYLAVIVNHLRVIRRNSPAKSQYHCNHSTC